MPFIRESFFLRFGDATTFINKDCRVLFGDISIVPLLGPSLGYLTAMCSLGWRNLVAFDWNDLPMGREFDGKFFKNVKSPLQLNIDRCISESAFRGICP